MLFLKIFVLQDKVQSIVDEILHPARLDPNVKWAELDNVVSGVSKDLTDDYPNADPRWAESGKQGTPLIH